MDSGNLLHEFLHRNKKNLFLVFALGLLHSISSFLIPLFIGDFFSIYFHAHSNKGRLLALFGFHFHHLNSYFLFFLVLIAVKQASSYFETLYGYYQSESFVRHIREKLFAFQINSSEENFSRKPFGNYLLRYSNDMKCLQSYLNKGVLCFIKDVVFIGTGMILLFFINSYLTGYLCLFLIVGFLLVYRFSGKQRSLISKSRSKRSGLLAHAASSFSRHRRISETSRKEKTIARFNRKSRELYSANMDNNRFESLLTTMIPSVQYLIIGLILLLIMHAQKKLIREDAFVFILVVMMLLSAIRRILKVPVVLNKGRISMQKIRELMIAGPAEQHPIG